MLHRLVKFRETVAGISRFLRFSRWRAAILDFQKLKMLTMVSVVLRMNEVILHRARLVLGWVTVFGRL